MNKAGAFAFVMTLLTTLFVSMSLAYGLWDTIVKLAWGVGLLMAVGLVATLFYLIGRMLFGKDE